jgi:hypothetical protein
MVTSLMDIILKSTYIPEKQKNINQKFKNPDWTNHRNSDKIDTPRPEIHIHDGSRHMAWYRYFNKKEAFIQ